MVLAFGTHEFGCMLFNVFWSHSDKKQFHIFMQVIFAELFKLLKKILKVYAFSQIKTWDFGELKES
jgi:hypothetical protein